MEKRRGWQKSKRYIFILVAMMAFIFMQSAFPATVSRVESHWVVTLLTHLLGSVPSNLTFLVRKTGHFLEYLFLGLVLVLAIFHGRRSGYAGKHRKVSARKRGGIPTLALAVLGGVLYAVSDELHQVFVPGRSGEVRDVLIDSGGVAVGVLLGWIIHHRRRVF